MTRSAELIDSMPGESGPAAGAGGGKLPLLPDLPRAGAATHHFRRPEERPFLLSERDRVTLLIGGLSQRADRLVLAAFEGLGYKVDRVPMPQKADFQAGREYGNNGQCNPTYFVVGALVNYLKRLRDEQGLSTDAILSDYVFFTAGSCGPCRFGMYEAEYRLALRNAGFDGFRVVLFQQSGGLSESDVELALQLDVDLLLAILPSILIADLLNEVAYQVRPYEVEPGRADEVLERCLVLCQDELRRRPQVSPGPATRLLARLTPIEDPGDLSKLLGQLLGDRFTALMRRCRALIDEEIEVDFLRARPIVKITGEFWAQTTEGDGNFRMFSFLENEGAEVLVEPVGTWINYLLNEARNNIVDRRGLERGTELPAWWQLGKKLSLARRYRVRAAALTLAEKLLRREYERLRQALGGTAHPLVRQLELQRLGHPYYNSRSSGGEGHLEVAKNIYYTHQSLCHMVLSLKPFGCMPSTQSDGTQAAVISRYPDMIFLPIETSGEGDVNAHSRVQMALGEAKAKCKAELEACLQRVPWTLDQIRAYVRRHRELRRPLLPIPRRQGVVGRTARFVLQVAGLMSRDASWAPAGGHRPASVLPHTGGPGSDSSARLRPGPDIPRRGVSR